MKTEFVVMFLFLIQIQVNATFSIVAVDSSIGEIGYAIVSCIDKYNMTSSDGSTPFFLSALVSGKGAVYVQCMYLRQNRENALKLLIEGKTAPQIKDLLVANDFENRPEWRQYGMVILKNGHPEIESYTVANAYDYKGVRMGKDFSIQGNLLLGTKVLMSK